jgi:predicted DNA-binding transcriptional regulator AlpA
MAASQEAPPSPTRVSSLEKIPAAAKRMCISSAQFYREVKAGRVGPIIKIGQRASAVPQDSVDQWISDRISAATRLARRA